MRLLLTLLLGIGIASAQAIPIDSDGDKLLDSDEDTNLNGIMDTGETDPHNADTDGGGEADGKEILNNRNPLDKKDDYTFDQDNDGLKNGQEEALGTSATNPDTDGDGVNDSDDPFPLDNRYSADTDGDGIPDEYEEKEGLSSEKRSDAEEDNDEDGLSNIEEFIQGTKVNDPDTDNDGVEDGKEVEVGTDPEENPCLLYTGTGKSFPDIQDHWGASIIRILHRTKVLPSHNRVVDGYNVKDETLFLPDREITRYELLKMALLTSCITLLEETDNASLSFTDVPSNARPKEEEERRKRRLTIYTAVDAGVVEGYEDGSFRPDASINRAEALKILLKTTNLEPLEEPLVTEEFSDVPEDAWFAPYVKRLVEYSIVEGYAGGTFQPGRLITRAEASKILLLMMINNPNVNGYVIPTDEL